MVAANIHIAQEGTDVVASKLCAVTGQTYQVRTRVDEWSHWLNDRWLIQDAMPDLTAEQREFLMSGMTPAEWELEFGSTDT